MNQLPRFDDDFDSFMNDMGGDDRVAEQTLERLISNPTTEHKLFVQLILNLTKWDWDNLNKLWVWNACYMNRHQNQVVANLWSLMLMIAKNKGWTIDPNFDDETL